MALTDEKDIVYRNLEQFSVRLIAVLRKYASRGELLTLVNTVGSLNNLTTADKSSLVSAINEIKAGGISEEAISQVITAYLEEHGIDVSSKQDVIPDLATIRSGAAAGATALQPSSIIDTLTSVATNAPLSANQGKVLKGLIDQLSQNLDLLTGESDTTATIDTFNEIKNFLNSYTNTQGLSNILQTLENNLHQYVATSINNIPVATVDDINNIPLGLGKFHGTYSNQSSLPTVTEEGYAYVGTSSPYQVWEYSDSSWSNTGYNSDTYNNLLSSEHLLVVQENGFFVVDSNYNIGMSYTSDGLDAAKLSTHFKNLLNQ